MLAHLPFSRFRHHSIHHFGLTAIIALATTTAAFPAAAGGGGVVGVVLRAVVIEGDPSPDGDGFFSQLGLPSINDAGEISFVANMSGTLTGGGVFRERSTGLEVAARAGEPAPDGNGTLFFFNVLAPAPINDDGDVAFSNGLQNTSGGGFSGIFAAGAALRQIVRLDQAAPDGNGTFATFDSIGIEDSGDVTFWASFNGTKGGAFVDDRGAFRGAGSIGKGGGAIDTLLRAGNVVPNEGPATFGNVPSTLASHPDGWVAISAFLNDTPNPPTDGAAIFVDRDGILNRRITTGDPSPDSDGTLSALRVPFVGDDGTVAVHATFANSDGGLSDNMGIVAYDFFGGSDVIVREGDDGPEEGTFAVDFLDALGFASNIVAPNRMIFHGFLNGTSGGSSTDTGLFLHTPQQISEIVRKGDDTPSLDGTFNDFRFGIVHVNPAAQVVFFAQTTGGSQGDGLFYRTPGDLVSRLARVGQPLLGSEIQVVDMIDDEQARLAGVSPLNARGDVTFWVRLLDGREAIIATNVPEPSGALCATAAAITLLGLSRRRRIRV